MTPEGRAWKPGPPAVPRASSVRDTDGGPGDPRALLDPYRRAVRRQPQDARAWYGRAWLARATRCFASPPNAGSGMLSSGRAGVPEPRLLPRRPDAARPRRRAAGDRDGNRAPARAHGRGGRLGDPPDRQHEHGAGDARGLDRARPRPPAPRLRRVRRVGAGPRLPPRPGAPHPPRHPALGGRRDLGDRAPRGRGEVRRLPLVRRASRGARPRPPPAHPRRDGGSGDRGRAGGGRHEPR